MNDQEELKATLMAKMKKITKASALESIRFLMGLHNISVEDIKNSVAKKGVKKV